MCSSGRLCNSVGIFLCDRYVTSIWAKAVRLLLLLLLLLPASELELQRRLCDMESVGQ